MLDDPHVLNDDFAIIHPLSASPRPLPSSLSCCSPSSHSAAECVSGGHTYFVDCDPAHFGPVLNFLRHGAVHMGPDVLDGVRRTAEALHLWPLAALCEAETQRATRTESALPDPCAPSLSERDRDDLRAELVALSESIMHTQPSNADKVKKLKWARGRYEEVHAILYGRPPPTAPACSNLSNDVCACAAIIGIAVSVFMIAKS